MKKKNLPIKFLGEKDIFIATYPNNFSKKELNNYNINLDNDLVEIKIGYNNLNFVTKKKNLIDLKNFLLILGKEECYLIKSKGTYKFNNKFKNSNNLEDNDEEREEKLTNTLNLMKNKKEKIIKKKKVIEKNKDISDKDSLESLVNSFDGINSEDNENNELLIYKKEKDWEDIEVIKQSKNNELLNKRTEFENIEEEEDDLSDDMSESDIE